MPSSLEIEAWAKEPETAIAGRWRGAGKGGGRGRERRRQRQGKEEAGAECCFRGEITLKEPTNSHCQHLSREHAAEGELGNHRTREPLYPRFLWKWGRRECLRKKKKHT